MKAESRHTSLIGTAIAAAAAMLLPNSLFSSAMAADVVATQENGGKLVSKTINLDPKVFDPKNATGTATTNFVFHLPAPVTSTYTKNVTTNVVNPDPFTHNYPGGELHGTTGSATYDVSIGKVIEGGKTKFTIGAKVEGKIQPGKNNNAKVTINADVKDPFNFSANPDAQFDAHPEGLEYSFSLQAGTAFPAVFAPDLQSFGAVASDTSMHFAARVAPGFVTDATSFWSASQPGGIDLFELVITSDAAHVVNAALTFGANTPDFTLDFKDQSGTPFDPTDPADVDAIESLIESSFATGVVGSSLEDAFTVGFVPGTTVSEYTFGTGATLNFGAVEVIPEPSTWAMLCAGIVVLFGYGRRFALISAAQARTA